MANTPERESSGRRIAAAPIDFTTLPSGVSYEVVPLTAEDGAGSRGFLYTRGGEKTVVCFMHPRADMSRHYAMPALLEAGYATFGHQSRYLNNDIACLHEALLADVAAGLRFLKEAKGFQHIVLLGNSGGGSLYSFYQSQAATPPPGRLSDTAAGDPYDLNGFELPQADAMVFLACHLGEGKYMLNVIDPAVTDESDPLSCDPALDMYNPANGFKEPPQTSRYEDEFLARYRVAQRERVARLDAIARGYIAEQRYFQGLRRQPEFAASPMQDRIFASRRAVVDRYMTIYRTEANPAFCDPSLFPSKRSFGSLMGSRPDLANYKAGVFGNYQTPQAWLSTWSGLSSRAAVLAVIPKVTIPTLIVSYTGDNAIFPFEAEAILEQSPARDKTLRTVDGDHFGMPLPSAPNQGGREEAVRLVAQWLRERFPAR
jgi:hypothetical protein